MRVLFLILGFLFFLSSAFAEMEDIHDIEEVKFFWFNDFIIFPFFAFLFFVLFYFILARYLWDRNKSNSIRKVEKKNFSEIDEIINKLKKLKKSSEKLEKEDFYEKLNSIFRDYFKISWVKMAENMSLKELETVNPSLDIDIKILNIFKISYFWEFNNKADNYSSRKKMIDDFIDMICKS